MKRIEPNNRHGLLKSLNLGTSAAETDTKLIEARIETDIFGELVRDEIDIIRGIKGSGKTALFRIFNEHLRESFYKNDRVVLIPGVETVGDPVFQQQKKLLNNMTVDELKDFWVIWIIVLINNELIKNERFKDLLKTASPLVAKFDKICADCNLPTFEAKASLKDLGKKLSKIIPKFIKLGVASPEGYKYSAEITPSLFENENKENEPRPLYSKEILDIVEGILQKCDIVVWVMLDRLDEAFPRRSELERRALKALLDVYKNISNETIRLKVFIRDDIFDLVTKGADGFTALTHVMSRTSRTLEWTERDIVHLVVKRVFSDELVAAFYGVDLPRLEKDFDYREKMFYEVFPKRMGGGQSGRITLNWIYNRCMDGSRAVTPRDVIELLRYARFFELDRVNDTGIKNDEPLLGIRGLKYGHEKLSKIKKENYLQAEFPKLWPSVKLFEGQKAEHNEVSLKKLLGHEWKDITEKLVLIGFFNKSVGKNIYTIPFLFRPGLEIKQGKAYQYD